MPFFMLNYMKKLQKNDEKLFKQACLSLQTHLEKKPLTDPSYAIKKFLVSTDETPKFIYTLAPFRQRFLTAKHPVSPVVQITQTSQSIIESLAVKNEDLKRYVRAMFDFAFKEMLDDNGEISAEILELTGLQQVMQTLSSEERRLVRDKFTTVFVTDYLFSHVEKMCPTNQAYENDVVNLISSKQLTNSILAKLAKNLVEVTDSEPNAKEKKYIKQILAMGLSQNKIAEIQKTSPAEIPGKFVELIIQACEEIAKQPLAPITGLFAETRTKHREKEIAKNTPDPVLFREFVQKEIATIFHERQANATVYAHTFVQTAFNAALPLYFAEVAADFVVHGKQLVQDFANVDFLEYLLNEPLDSKNEIFNDKPALPVVIKKPQAQPQSVINMLAAMQEESKEVVVEVPKKQPFPQDVLSDLEQYFHQLILQSGKVAAEEVAKQEMLAIFIKKIVFLAYAEILNEEGNLKEELAQIFNGKSREEILSAYLRKLLITIILKWLGNDEVQAELTAAKINPEIYVSVVGVIQDLLAQGLTTNLLTSLKAFPLFGRSELADKFALGFQIKSILPIVTAADYIIRIVRRACEDVAQFVRDRRALRLTAIKEKNKTAVVSINSCELIVNESQGVGKGGEVLAAMLSKYDECKASLEDIESNLLALEHQAADLKSQKMTIQLDSLNLALHKINLYKGQPANTPVELRGMSPHQFGIGIAEDILAHHNLISSMPAALSSEQDLLSSLLSPALNEIENLLSGLQQNLTELNVKMQSRPASTNPFEEEKDDGEGYVIVNHFELEPLDNGVASELDLALAGINDICRDASAKLDPMVNPEQYVAELNSELTQEVEQLTQQLNLANSANETLFASASHSSLPEIGFIDAKITAVEKGLEEIVETANEWKSKEVHIKQIKKLAEGIGHYLHGISSDIHLKKHISVQNREFYLARKKIIIHARLKDFVWADLSDTANKIDQIESVMQSHITWLWLEVESLMQKPLKDINLTNLEQKFTHHKAELENNKTILFKAADAIITRVGPVQDELMNVERTLDVIYSKILYMLLGYNQFWSDRIGFFGGGTAFLSMDNQERVFPKRAVAMMMAAKRHVNSNATADIKLMDIADAFQNTKAGWSMGRSKETTTFYNEVAKPLVALLQNNLYDSKNLNEFNKRLDTYMKSGKPEYQCREGYMQYAVHSKVSSAVILSESYDPLDGDSESTLIDVKNEAAANPSNDRKHSFSSFANGR